MKKATNVGALMIRIGFGGILYYNCNTEPPKPYSNYSGPYSTMGPMGKPQPSPGVETLRRRSFRRS